MKKYIAFGLLLFAVGIQNIGAQQMLCLDSCRAMALRNNKQMGVSQLKQEVAVNLRKSARTKYLPHVSAIGSYQFTSEEVSLLNNEQKSSLSNLGTTMAGSLQGLGNGLNSAMAQIGSMLTQLGVPAASFQEMAGNLQQNMQQGITNTAGLLNTEGQKIVDAFRTDTRNIFAGSVLVTQPVFMGGGIVALNKLADINEDFAANSAAARRQAVVYATDQAYWQVVSLKHKQRLAESYLSLIKKFDGDVQKMIVEGVATKSDGLSVSVKVNEAEMTLQRVNDGLVLSKMLLCQMIGLPMNEQITLVDEDSEDLAVVTLKPQLDVERAIENRPELKMLSNTVDMTKQTTNILKAANLPQVALMGGYAVSNPNVLNGFEKKFGGFWNVGVLVRVPLWNWGDVAYKVRASKGATAIAHLELAEAREKIELQVNQNTFKVDESNKRLAMAQTGIERANENLRTANLGFSEGVISPTVVMEAQTAWLQAQSQLIDAQIAVKLSQVELQKALGALEYGN
ncbi:TolC family protein [Prevotella sp. E15-22]|uniref:TolC family protein n=1 Tax=Prevotella sp. E15-22 TaxID=2937774 RepID=UPI002051C97C|nr:TolC family protein [Prevotella sp. E15-22]UPS43745.1 TolC family protein [Prevotella sp. E15-22]